MDSKFYVSLEAAKLLKEKGYNEMTDCSIDEDGNFWNEQRKNETMPEWKWSCPTKAEVIDWLDKKIHIGIGYNDLHSKWHYDMTPVIPGTKAINNLSFSTRLEAEEAAIIDALELL